MILHVLGDEIRGDEYIEDQYRRGQLMEKRRRLDAKKQEIKNENIMTVWMINGQGVGILAIINKEQFDPQKMIPQHCHLSRGGPNLKNI